MKNIFLFGECMIELMTTSQGTSANTMKQSFAGDVFNTAVYLKRTFADFKVHLVTAVGKDPFSLDMVQYFKSENIAVDFVFKSENKIPGLYSIQLDEQGERSFTYWRENSAARQIMQHIDEQATSELSKGDVFFFSGISLAVVEPQARGDFWALVEKLKAAGVKIVFDPNYRPRLWANEEEAKQQFDKAFAVSNLVLPGIDDFESLYRIDSVEDIITFFQSYNVDELVVKNGSLSLLTLSEGIRETHLIKPADNVVDTTSAGDAFNGGYLGARLQGASITDSVELAAKVAGFVIQHKGAIVNKDSFNHFIQSQLNS